MKIILLAILLFASLSKVEYGTSDHLTTSGISSGAFFAHQYHYIFSAKVKGSGLFAGGPFYCAGGVAATAVTLCMKDPALIIDQTLKNLYYGLETAGFIDKLSNMAKSKVYIFAGSADSEVKPAVS